MTFEQVREQLTGLNLEQAVARMQSLKDAGMIHDFAVVDGALRFVPIATADFIFVPIVPAMSEQEREEAFLAPINAAFKRHRAWTEASDEQRESWILTTAIREARHKVGRQGKNAAVMHRVLVHTTPPTVVLSSPDEAEAIAKIHDVLVWREGDDYLAEIIR